MKPKGLFIGHPKLSKKSKNTLLGLKLARYGSGFGGYEFLLSSSTTYIYKEFVLVQEVCSKLSKFLKASFLIYELGFWTSKEYILLIFWYFWVIPKTSFSSKGYQQITSKVPRSFHVEETWWRRKITSHPDESPIFHMWLQMVITW